MTKIVTVLGARPQFVKASVVSAVMIKDGRMNEVLVHTGQHFDPNMSEVFFTDLEMSDPKYHLGISGGNHGEMTGRMLIEVEKVLLSESPDIVLVYGDTNSTLAGALAAAKLHIPVAHVEAGLRSFNMSMPEEINRILTDQVSKWLFAPTDGAVTHLQREGINPSRVHQVGDVMYDVALQHGERASRMKTNAVMRLGLQDKHYVLATIHRAENTDDPERLRVIVDAFIETSRHLPVVWPLHPRTRGVLSQTGMLPAVERAVLLTEPLGYLEIVQLERSAAVIATDSGGVQKEAFFHRVPCVTLRDETEWVELVSAGWNALAPPVSPEAIQFAIEAAVGRQGANVEPYGRGDAAQRIVRCLADGLAK
ncbi:MAG TPA: UDP-N-acetylglucosamine 2-epimerase (non-hydrolyzing) [Gammaproteobacteria bacterium]|nr:UDP-N-acetylglucosamine 2-epimerase (non-hydrolyzing) [Gammaproteobacteria bacterium]